MLKLSAIKRGTPSIVNVVIDNDSIDEIAPLPWPRTLYADIFDFLEISKAKIIVFDAILTGQNEIKQDKEFLNRIKK